MANPPLILGSASPRRSALLRRLGVTFDVATVDLDEQSLVRPDDAAASVRLIARAKFEAFGSIDADQLLTADTLVACDQVIMGKPNSDDDLVSMLQAMSGRVITVVTALCLGAPATTPGVETVTTMVQLRQLDHDEIDAYVATGVGRDKAGGLALQAEAGSFIKTIEGCWSNVLGLPVCAVAAALDRAPGGTQADLCTVELCGSPPKARAA